MPNSVKVTRVVQLLPHAVVPVGETGRYLGRFNGQDRVKLDRHYPGLVDYDNTIWFDPDDEPMEDYCKPYERRGRKRCAAMLALAAFAISAPVSYAALFGSQPNPVTIEKIWLDKDSVRPGEPLQMTYIGHRTRNCAITLHRVIMRMDADRTIVDSAARVGTSMLVSEVAQERHRTIKLPILEPGRYAIQDEVLSQCPDGHNYVTDVPELQFHVLPDGIADYSRRG